MSTSPNCQCKSITKKRLKSRNFVIRGIVRKKNHDCAVPVHQNILLPHRFDGWTLRGMVTAHRGGGTHCSPCDLSPSWFSVHQSTTDLSTNTLGTSLWGENGVWTSRPPSAATRPTSATMRAASAATYSGSGLGREGHWLG